MDGAQLRERLRINKHLLDDELEIQPQLYYDASMLAVDARRTRDECKSGLDIARAAALSDIRLREDKITDTRANKMVESHPDVVEAKQTFGEWNSRVGEAEALAAAISQRSHSLTSLANLSVSGYFSRDGIGVRTSDRPTVHRATERRRMPS